MHGGDDSIPPVISLIAGGTAGGIESFLTYPFEYAKTRVQLKGEYAPRNPFQVVAKVYQKEGIKALYMGCGPLVAVRHDQSSNTS
jgi:solute carrier family 25 citrate transporter 1